MELLQLGARLGLAMPLEPFAHGYIPLLIFVTPGCRAAATE